MKKHSIAFRLSLYIILAVSTVISIVVYLNYDFSKKVLMQNIEEAAINQSGLVINKVARNVVAAQEISRNVAAQTPYYLLHNDLDLFLKGVVQSNKIIYGLNAKIFGTDDSDTLYFSVFRNDENQPVLYEGPSNYLDQHFSISSENEGDQTNGKWSKPYYCKLKENTLLISYYQDIKTPDGRKIGILSCEISLDFLNDIVSDIKIGERGFSFVVSETGEYITHPNKEWIMKRNIFAVSSKIFPDGIGSSRQLLADGKTVSGFAYPELLDFEKAWFYASPISYTNWLVIIVFPANELFKDLSLIFKEIIIVSAIGLLVVFLIIVTLFRQMLSPLMQLIRSIQRITLGERGRKSNRDELELLNDSLDELQQQYSRYIKEQSQSRKDRRKYDRDLKSAKEIQTTIIPASDPGFSKKERIELYAELHPAESIGGDLYDYFFIDPKHLLISMGDVSGKGIPAALFMAVAHTLIKSKATILSARHIIELVNVELSRQNTNQHFLTLFLGILNIETGELNYCNAAHNYPFIIRNEQKIDILDITHGLPIGLYASKPYTGDTIVLKGGDTIILYTDGVTDCNDMNDQFYGIDRLTENINNLKELRPKELIKRIIKSLRLFKGEAKQADDISLMAIRYLGKDL